MPRRSALVLLLLLIVATPHTAHGKGKASKRRARHAATSTGGTGQSLQASLVPAGDPVLSGAQHAELAAARELIQEDMAGGVQSYTAIAQRALAQGELTAADSVLVEGLAVIGAVGQEADFLAGSLLLVQASVHKCNNQPALALGSFDRMAELLPPDLAPDPERQEGVRSLFRLDLLRVMLLEGGTMKHRKALQRRRKAEERSLLRGGPWASLAQLPRDYQAGLRARPWWAVAGEGQLREPDASRLLEVLREAREGMVAEHAKLVAGGRMAPERECIHDSSKGEWTQLDFLGGAARRRQALGSTPCERGIAPAGCAAVAAVEAVLRQGGWGGHGGSGSIVMRAGYSAVEPGSWIRPHYGETNAQLKLHFGVTIPTNASGQPCALLRVGEDAADGWRGWSEGGLLLFDDSFLHEVKMQGGGGDESGCSGTRVVLQLVVRHPDAAG